jgi:hypothetical protein
MRVRLTWLVALAALGCVETPEAGVERTGRVIFVEALNVVAQAPRDRPSHVDAPLPGDGRADLAAVAAALAGDDLGDDPLTVRRPYTEAGVSVDLVLFGRAVYEDLWRSERARIAARAPTLRRLFDAGRRASLPRYDVRHDLDDESPWLAGEAGRASLGRVVKAGRLEVLRRQAEGDADGALDDCLDLLGVLRDLSWRDGLTALMAEGLAVTVAAECAAPLDAAATARRRRAIEQLARIRDGFPPPSVAAAQTRVAHGVLDALPFLADADLERLSPAVRDPVHARRDALREGAARRAAEEGRAPPEFAAGPGFFTHERVLWVLGLEPDSQRAWAGGRLRTTLDLLRVAAAASLFAEAHDRWPVVPEQLADLLTEVPVDAIGGDRFTFSDEGGRLGVQAAWPATRWDAGASWRSRFVFEAEDGEQRATAFATRGGGVFLVLKADDASDLTSDEAIAAENAARLADAAFLRALAEQLRRPGPPPPRGDEESPHAALQAMVGRWLHARAPSRRQGVDWQVGDGERTLLLRLLSQEFRAPPASADVSPGLWLRRGEHATDLDADLGDLVPDGLVAEADALQAAIAARQSPTWSDMALDAAAGRLEARLAGRPPAGSPLVPAVEVELPPGADATVVIAALRGGHVPDGVRLREASLRDRRMSIRVPDQRAAEQWADWLSRALPPALDRLADLAERPQTR